MSDPVWQKARDLAAKINAEIDMRCLSASPLQYRAVAEEIAAEHIDNEEWEYCLRHRMDGWPPCVVFLQYLKTPPREGTNDQTAS